MSLFSPNIYSRSPSRADITLKVYQQEKYVRQVWIFLASVIAALTLYNWTCRLRVYLTKPRPYNAEEKLDKDSEKASTDTSMSGATRKSTIHRLPVACASFLKVLLFRTTVPIGPSSVMTIAELIFITSYNAALLIWLWVDTRDMDTFFFEDRAAHIASSQVPLIVALAGKNNLISALTGVSHEKLNVLHRASGRTCLIFLWIHALIRAISGLSGNFSLEKGWMRWGVVGLAAFTLAAILSLRPLRNRFYEFFLVTHIILICLFIVGGLIHAGSKGFAAYFWPALIIWGLDRIIRVSYLIWKNRMWYWKTSDKDLAHVELLSNDMVRLTLRRKLHWEAGQHAYLILPSLSKLPSEAHPFTIASVPYRLDGSHDEKEKDVVFLIRAQGSFTLKLHEHALKEELPSTFPTFIDGPYGTPSNHKSYSTCLLIAGGSGISYTLPLLQDLVYHSKKGNSKCKRVLFIWVVRDASHLPWITKLLLESMVSASYDLSVEPQLFFTGKEFRSSNTTIINKNYTPNENDVPPYPRSSESMEPTDNLGLTSIRTFSGRPDVEQLIEDVVSTSSGPVLVDVAGPSSLTSAVRSAVSFEGMRLKEIMNGYPAVTLHTESFGFVKT